MKSHIIKKIRESKYDTILIRYCPYVDDDNNIINMSKDRDNKKLEQYKDNCLNNIELKYTEISLNDTYAIIDRRETDNIRYYKKRLYIYRPIDMKGIYILELHINSNQYSMPHIIDYQNVITYNKNIYKFENIDICYNTCNDREYIEINKTVDNEHIEDYVNNFINEIRKLNKFKIV